jgi:Tfp pilus assembly protein PilZ
LQKKSLQIRFESPDTLREEFEKNIANRGIFVATEENFEVQQSIELEIVLAYAGDSKVALSLVGEVVHCIPVEMAASGAVAGVAVQFDDSASQLREAFEPLLDEHSRPAVDPTVDREGRGRRDSPRGAVRVPVRVMPTMSPPFEATSRDLSATGILLTVKRVALPIGEIVRTCLWHPSGQPSIEIDGKVVRQIENKSGRIAAVAIAFDRKQSADPRVYEVIDGLRHAGHRSRLGGISGSIVDLGLANMLQMFGSSAPEGTLVVERDGEQGWIAFAGGQLLAAELGASSDHDALVSMLDWGDGRFQFEASADKNLVESGSSSSLEGAILKAMSAINELRRASEDGEADADDEDELANERPISIDEATTFRIDLEQEEISRSSLGKLEEAVLELARAGMPVAKMNSIIPEPTHEIQASLEGLVESGILVPR